MKRPAEEELDFVDHERNEPRYNSQQRRAEKNSEGPIGLGTRYQAEVGPVIVVRPEVRFEAV